MATTTKTCPGVKDGDQVISPAHQAPATEAVFGKNAARKDGLGRVCKADWAKYTAVLKARKVASGDAPAPKPRAAKPTAMPVTLPDGAAVETPEGQAALAEAADQAKASRRAADAERKRKARAAAKEAAATA